MQNTTGQFALGQLPERFRSKFDTEYEVVNGKQRFFIKGMAAMSPRFASLKEVHRYIADNLEHGKLAEYVHRKYSHFGYKRSKSICFNPEFVPGEKQDEQTRAKVITRDRYRWVENVTDGLRKVGDADDLVRLNHTGWYTDNWQDETVKGEVYQMPARDGKPVYIPAVNDPCNDDCACLDFTSTTDDKEDAARWADSMAESWAEREREYRAEEDRKAKLEEIEDEIKSTYQGFRELAREIRAECGKLQGVKVVRELVKREWQRTKADIHKLRAEQKRVEQYGVEYN